MTATLGNGDHTFLAFDLETTGIDPFTDLPVSYALVERARSEGTIASPPESGLINPGRAIPAEATEVHGITDEMVISGMELEAAAEFLASRLSHAWADGQLIVGMNVSYDLTMLESLCRRVGIASLSDRGPIGPVVDILVIDRHIDKYRKGRRKLVNLCEHYGVDLFDAHDAGADCAASLDVLEVMLERSEAVRDIPVDQISEKMATRYQAWLKNFSEYLVGKGGDPIPVGEFAWPIHEAPAR